jgi:hypothetical protein
MRSEMSVPNEESILQERTYSTSIYLPNGGAEDYALDNPYCSEILMQLNNNPGNSNFVGPSVALYTTTEPDGTGHWQAIVTWDGTSSPGKTYQQTSDANSSLGAPYGTIAYDLGPYTPDKGTWVTWTFHVKWGWLASQDPLLTVYKNGTQVLNLNGYPNKTNDGNGVDMQWGIYKWEWDGSYPSDTSKLTKRVVYQDNVWIKQGPFAPTVQSGTGSSASQATLTPDLITGAVSTYYTLDGSNPDNTKTPYKSPVTLSGAGGSTAMLKAVSYDASGNKGDIRTAVYTFQ